MKKHGKVVGKLLLVGAALVVAGLSIGAAYLSEDYHISPAWLLSFWAGVGFLLMIGRTYGLKNLGHPALLCFQ